MANLEQSNEYNPQFFEEQITWWHSLRWKAKSLKPWGWLSHTSRRKICHICLKVIQWNISMRERWCSPLGWRPCILAGQAGNPFTWWSQWGIMQALLDVAKYKHKHKHKHCQTLANTRSPGLNATLLALMFTCPCKTSEIPWHKTFIKLPAQLSVP